MKTFKPFFLLAYILFSLQAIGQSPNVIYIHGNVKTYKVGEPEKQAHSLVYGPLDLNNMIIMGTNSQIKLVKNNGEYCELTKPGSFWVKTLTYKPAESNSFLSSLGNYFYSFFQSHTYVESKENYQNNVFAISRGDFVTPVLDFPLSGLLPADQKKLTFSWTHKPDTITYHLTIFDRETKKPIFNSDTKATNFTLSNPSKILLPGKKYYWSVTVPNITAEFQTSSFEISATGDYKNQKKAIEENIKKQGLKLHNVPKTVYAMSYFQDKQWLNYAILYGQEMVTKSPKDEQLKKVVDKFYYGILDSRLKKN